MFSFICFNSSALFKNALIIRSLRNLHFPSSTLCKGASQCIPDHEANIGFFTYNLQPISEVAPIPITNNSLRRRCSDLLYYFPWRLTTDTTNCKLLNLISFIVVGSIVSPFQVLLLTSFEAFKGSLSSLSKVFNRKQKVIKESS